MDWLTTEAPNLWWLLITLPVIIGQIISIDCIIPLTASAARREISKSPFDLFCSLVFAPIVEEILFRCLPFTILVLLGWHTNVFVLLFVLLVSSILFALNHSGPSFWWKIRIQGAYGLMLGIAFVVFGGLLTLEPSLFMGLIASTILHGIYNLITELRFFLVIRFR